MRKCGKFSLLDSQPANSRQSIADEIYIFNVSIISGKLQSLLLLIHLLECTSSKHVSYSVGATQITFLEIGITRKYNLQFSMSRNAPGVIVRNAFSQPRLPQCIASQGNIFIFCDCLHKITKVFFSSRATFSTGHISQRVSACFF